MASSACAIPDEIAFHFVIKQQSVDALFNSLYTQPNDITKQHFLSVNSHLQQQVRPGQMVIIYPPNAQQCTAYEAELSEAAQRIDKQLAAQSEEEARIMAQYYDLLAYTADKSGFGYGVAMTYFQHHKNQVKQILGQIEKLYVQQYNRQGQFNNNTFYQQRQRLFQQLDTTLKTMVGRARMGINFQRGNLKASLGLSSKSILHQLKDHPSPVTNIPGFEKNHSQIMKYSKVLKHAGYVGIALDGVQSVATIQKACAVGTETTCTRTKFSEGGRLVGSVGGGSFGGFLASYGTCNFLFGIESAGTSLLWCGIVAGGVGGYVGGSFLGGVFKSGGEIVYENVYSTK